MLLSTKDVLKALGDITYYQESLFPISPRQRGNLQEIFNNRFAIDDKTNEDANLNAYTNLPELDFYLVDNGYRGAVELLKKHNMNAKALSDKQIANQIDIWRGQMVFNQLLSELKLHNNDYATYTNLKKLDKLVKDKIQKLNQR